MYEYNYNFQKMSSDKVSVMQYQNEIQSKL